MGSHTARRTPSCAGCRILFQPSPPGQGSLPRAACASHLPEALIHRTPSIFTEGFPEPACTSSGSRPKRAETSIRAWISECLVPDTVPAPAYANLQSPLAASQYVIEVNPQDLPTAGTSSSGIGFP